MCTSLKTIGKYLLAGRQLCGQWRPSYLSTLCSTAVFRDLGLGMRNRIIWHFEHGLHCSKRFSGRYETIIWFTKSDDYIFNNLDPIRVLQKYPGKKHFKGPLLCIFMPRLAGANAMNDAAFP